MDETIVAIATPPGVGALSVIRISGSEAIEVISQCFSHTHKLQVNPRLATLGTVRDERNEPLDEVLATYFSAPASFTGEDVVELSCHGGLYVTQAVLERLIEAGAKSAEPGAFTQRAFLNGKLDLTQAEGIMDIISAQSDLALKAAQNQLHGSIQTVTQQLRGDLIELTAHLEAYIDFPEDDIDPETGGALSGRIDGMLALCEGLLSTTKTGKLLREGARVVLCGEPNAGKSSLLNCLLGFERAIVSAERGTTRDTVEEVMNVGGLPIRFIDTAGLRETEQKVEQQGITRAYREMESADLILEVIDGSSSPGEVQRPPIPSGASHIVILNKRDRGIHEGWRSCEYAELSCHQGSGISELVESIKKALLNGQALTGSSLIAINARHQSCLKTIVTVLKQARSEIINQHDPELISLSLREALEAIGELSGRVDTEEVLGEIFSQFCIGK